MKNDNLPIIQFLIVKRIKIKLGKIKRLRLCDELESNIDKSAT